jgi:hypothetical protein
MALPAVSRTLALAADGRFAALCAKSYRSATEASFEFCGRTCSVSKDRVLN